VHGVQVVAPQGAPYGVYEGLAPRGGPVGGCRSQSARGEAVGVSGPEGDYGRRLGAGALACLAGQRAQLVRAAADVIDLGHDRSLG